MSNFSQIYMNSSVFKTILENVPESERETFMQHIRENMEQYDSFAGLGWEKSSIAQVLRGDVAQEQPTRRPPRRG